MSYPITLSGQITTDDVKTLADQGIKTIINNRPDFEEAGQPTSDEIAKACQEHGIFYTQIAFAGGMMQMHHLEEFAEFYNKSPKPVHLFCRTGNRSNGLVSKAVELDLLDEE